MKGTTQRASQGARRSQSSIAPLGDLRYEELMHQARQFFAQHENTGSVEVAAVSNHQEQVLERENALLQWRNDRSLAIQEIHLQMAAHGISFDLLKQLLKGQ